MEYRKRELMFYSAPPFSYYCTKSGAIPEATNPKPVRAVVVGHIGTTRIGVQVIRVITAVRRRRPQVRVATLIVESGTIVVVTVTRKRNTQTSDPKARC